MPSYQGNDTNNSGAGEGIDPFYGMEFQSQHDGNVSDHAINHEDVFDENATSSMRSHQPWRHLQTTHTIYTASSTATRTPQARGPSALVDTHQPATRLITQGPVPPAAPQYLDTVDAVDPGSHIAQELPGPGVPFDLAIDPELQDAFVTQPRFSPAAAPQGLDIGGTTMPSATPTGGLATYSSVPHASFGAPAALLRDNLPQAFLPAAAPQGFNIAGATMPNATHNGGLAAYSSVPHASFGAPAPPSHDNLPQAFLPAVAPQGFHPLASAVPAPSLPHSRRPNARARGEARRGQAKPDNWTKDEERTLVRMCEEGRTWPEIARALGKSISAVQGKKWRLDGGDPKAYKKNCGGRGGRGGHGGGSHGGSGGGIAA